MSGREKPLILQNGMPIPQAYDKDLGDWTEYSTEHIKAIKAELALVKAELQAIKANQLSGDQKVQLSGTIPQRVIIIPREIRSVPSPYLYVRPPNGAKGFAATLDIWGATGTFESGEGAGIVCLARGQENSAHRSMGLDITTDKSTSRYSCPTIIMYPGIRESLEPSEYVLVSRVAYGQYAFRILISGTFAADEGIDCALTVEWLL